MHRKRFQHFKRRLSCIQGSGDYLERPVSDKQQERSSIKRPTFVLSCSHLATSLNLVFEVLALTRSVATTTTCCAESDLQSTNVSEFCAAFNIRSFNGRTLLSLSCALANTREACRSVLEAWDHTAESATRHDTCRNSCCSRGYPRRFTVPIFNWIVHAGAKGYGCGQPSAAM